MAISILNLNTFVELAKEYTFEKHLYNNNNKTNKIYPHLILFSIMKQTYTQTITTTNNV